MCVTKALDLPTLKSIGAVPRRTRTQSIEYEDDDKSEGGPKPTAKEDAPARAMSSLEALCADDSDDATALIVLTETSLQTITPKNGHQAVNCTRSSQWIAAMNREKQCHTKNGTFGEEWTASQGAIKPIPADWVFKLKYRGPPIDEKFLQPNQYKLLSEASS